MGYEFNIHLRGADIKAIETHPRGPSSITQLLTEIPCYRSVSEDQRTFFYSADESSEGRWLSYIVIKEDRLELCSNHASDYQCIVPFLLDRLVYLCGCFEIEEA